MTAWRHLKDAAELVEELMAVQQADPDWLPRSRAAAARMLRTYERLAHLEDGEDHGATLSSERTGVSCLVHLPSLWSGSDAMFSHERVLLRPGYRPIRWTSEHSLDNPTKKNHWTAARRWVALHFFVGHGRALPRGVNTGHIIADWIVRSVIVDCLRLH